MLDTVLARALSAPPSLTQRFGASHLHAEDLSGRYADVEHGRLTGFAGHGGLIDNGRVVQECLAFQSTTIQHTHDVGVVLR